VIWSISWNKEIISRSTQETDNHHFQNDFIYRTQRMTGDNLKPFNSTLDPFASQQNRHTARTQSILDLKTRLRFQSLFCWNREPIIFLMTSWNRFVNFWTETHLLAFSLLATVTGLKPLTFGWCKECLTIVLLLLTNLKFSLLIMIQTIKLVR
jgi:hypothetical protein